MPLKTETINSQEYTYFPWVPNGQSIDFWPEYRTVIAQSPRSFEQRRALNDRPTISVGGNYIYAGLEAEKIYNDIRAVLQKYIIFPLPVEPIHGVSLITVALNTVENNSLYWYLRTFATHVFAIDLANPDTYEINEIFQFGNDFNITFTGSFAESFPVETSIFYPAMFARIENKPDFSVLTDRATDINLVIKEVFF